jgi:hypothetical protein
MQYDFAVEKMPGYRYGPGSIIDRNEKSKRIWQVVMIERDDMGQYVKTLDVHRANMTYDEATSAWNQLRQELIKAQRSKDKQ